MDTAICDGKVSDLLGAFMPSTVWWALAGSTALVILFITSVTMFLLFHSQRPRNRKTDAAIEHVWRMGSIPTVVVGLIIAYIVFKSIGFFYTELHYVQSYYNTMCIYPTVSGLLSQPPTTLN